MFLLLSSFPEILHMFEQLHLCHQGDVRRGYLRRQVVGVKSLSTGQVKGSSFTGIIFFLVIGRCSCRHFLIKILACVRRVPITISACVRRVPACGRVLGTRL